MKKLLLFLITLFSILSFQAFAVNYGCGENIPPHVCGAAPPPSYDNYGGDSSYIQFKYAFAYDKDSGLYGAGKNVNGGTAKKRL